MPRSGNEELLNLTVVAVAEPRQLGYHLSAVIGLRTDPVRTESVATALSPPANSRSHRRCLRG